MWWVEVYFRLPQFKDENTLIVSSVKSQNFAVIFLWICQIVCKGPQIFNSPQPPHRKQCPKLITINGTFMLIDGCGIYWKIIRRLDIITRPWRMREKSVFVFHLLVKLSKYFLYWNISRMLCPARLHPGSFAFEVYNSLQCGVFYTVVSLYMKWQYPENGAAFLK